MEDCSYEECKKLILDHLAPAPTKFTKRYKLRSCVQEGKVCIIWYLINPRTGFQHKESRLYVSMDNGYDEECTCSS